MKKKLFLLLCALLTSVGMWATVDWTDKTSLITNPSFETDDAISDLKNCGWATDRVTGWTISPSSSSNAQVGVGNSSSTISDIGYTSFEPYAGVKYFYTRNNWNKNTNYSFSQVITRDGDNLKAGLYKVTCKAATYSSDAAFNTLTLGLKEGTSSAVTHNGIVLNRWNTWGVIIYKRADDTNLTIEVNFIPGYDGSNKHYALLMDDFHLEYISEEDAFTASSSNTIDFSDIINNATIYNHSSNTTMPRGWTAFKHTTGNGNYTEGGLGDTRLEGWNGGNLDIDYYQQITNLPVGSYTVTAATQERAKVGRTYVYAYTEGQDKATGLVNNTPEYDVTTSELKVSNGTMNIGIESTANDWVTADNFRISFLGFDVDAVKAEYETAYNNATTARDAAENANIVGTERTALVSVITTYTTSVTQSYSWYVSAKEALEDATTTFTAAKTNYDALVAEIAKAKALGIADATADSYAATSSSTAATALTNTQNLMVVEYNYATENYATPIDLGAWTETGTNTMPATFSNEHWSGTTREYKNQNDNNGQGYNASSWSMGLDQDIVLPAGDYVFKVAGRKSADATMTLTVTNKATSAVLGTVADFPSGNSSRGINKSGATAFEGDNEEFAHGGAGYGWQWRYVPFSLDAETTVNIAVTAGSSLIHNWASFGDYAVWSKPNAAASMIAYNKAKEDAGTAKTTYPQVTGSELTELNAALDADPGSTVETIDAATALIKTKTSALIAAAPSYDAYVLAKSYGEAINSTLLPYASTAKLSAVTTALSASVTSAATAETATAAINTANRAAYESNMNAEGVTGAKNRTSLVINADANDTDGWTGAFGRMSNEPYTEADGTASNTYFDKNGVKSFTSSQTIKLVAGTYILSVTARAQAGIDSYKLKVTNNADETEEVALTAIGNANGVFNRGWNVATVEFTQKAFGDATISIEADNTTSDANLWMSWDRFRLVSIADEGSYSATIGTTGWTTFASAYPLDLSKMTASTGNVKAYYASSVGDGKIVVTSTESEGVAARTGLMLKGTAGATITIPVTASGDAISGNMLVGCTTETPVDASETCYVLINNGGTAEFQSLKTNGATIPAGKAYLNTGVNSSARLIISFDDEDPTAINAIEAAEAETGALKDGKYLIGNKIVIVKNGVKYSANGQKLN